jgi:Zn finger protein HypA/HybF involved in hydrogenase expression
MAILSQLKSLREDKPVKRICEQTWHPEIELEKYQECPYCKSESANTIKIEEMK